MTYTIQSRVKRNGKDRDNDVVVDVGPFLVACPTMDVCSGVVYGNTPEGIRKFSFGRGRNYKNTSGRPSVYLGDRSKVDVSWVHPDMLVTVEFDVIEHVYPASETDSAYTRGYIDAWTEIQELAVYKVEN